MLEGLHMYIVYARTHACTRIDILQMCILPTHTCLRAAGRQRGVVLPLPPPSGFAGAAKPIYHRSSIRRNYGPTVASCVASYVAFAWLSGKPFQTEKWKPNRILILHGSLIAWGKSCEDFNCNFIHIALHRATTLATTCIDFSLEVERYREDCKLPRRSGGRWTLACAQSGAATLRDAYVMSHGGFASTAMGDAFAIWLMQLCLYVLLSEIWNVEDAEKERNLV